MNREEILAMEAGEELDELIADALGLPKANYNLPNETNYYSTDISAAWQVVEKLRSMEDGEGHSLLCCLHIYSDHDLCWDIRWSYSELGNRNDGHKKHRLPTCYDKFPEAICKAALRIKYSR